MSQVVKLKRTAVEGKVPSTNNIELGELAINTYDGRIFFEKDNGTPSIQQVVTTNSQTTGSLNIQGNVTASYFFGDGSGLTNLPASDVSQVATVTSSFDNQSSIVIEHNFNSKNVFISVYDTNDSQIIPQSVILTNNNTATIGLSGNHSGYVVVGKGGHLVSGSLVREVSEVATVTASFDNQSSINVSHNFNSRNVIVSVYDSSYSQLIPEILTLTDENSVDITLSGNHSGHVVVAKGGHFVSGSIISEADFTELTNVPNGLVSGSSQLTSSYDERYVISGSITQTTWDNIENKPLGIVSGSSQLTSSYDTRYALSGSSQSTFNRTVESYTTTEGQTIFTTTATASVGNVDVYINGFKLLTSDFDVTNSNTITLTTGSSAGEQVEINLYNAFAGTYLTTEDLNGFISSSSQVEFNSVNNTPFSQSVNQVTTTKSIVPTTSTIDLGTAEKPFRDLYLSSASLYIDGQQVISSNASELVITTDNGQSIKLFEQGADDIILQTEDGNIELKGTVELQTGKKIIDSGGTQILFGNSLGITGSISLTGTVDGVNISQLKSDFDNIEGKSLISGSSQISYVGLSNIPSGIISGSTQVSFNGITDKPILVSGSSQIVYTSLSSIPSGIVSGSSQITAASTTNFSTDVKSELNSNTVVSGSSQILTLVSIDEDTMVSNSDTKVPTQQSVKNYVDTKVADLVSGSPETLDTLNELATALGNDPNFATTVSNQIGGKVSQSLEIIAGNGLSGGGDLTTNRTLDVVSANNGIIVNSDNIELDTTSTTFTSGVKTKLNTDGVVSGSSQVSFSGIVDKPTLVSGSSQVSYTGLSSIPSGIVSGSSQITLSSTTGYGSVINQAVLTSSSPTFAGITISGKVTATSAGVDGTFADAFVSQYSSNNSEQNAIQTSVSSQAVSSGFRFQVSNGGGSSSRTNVVDFKRDRAIFNTSIGIGTDSPRTAATGGNKTLDVKGGIYFGSTNSESTCINNDDSFIINFDSNNDGGTSNFLRIAKGTTGETGGTELLRVNGSGHVLPGANGTQDLGSSSLRWSTIYTSDLSLNNGIGDWTIVEGEDDLFLYNNKKGKVYKFALTEVDPSVATPKKS